MYNHTWRVCAHTLCAMLEYLKGIYDCAYQACTSMQAITGKIYKRNVINILGIIIPFFILPLKEQRESLFGCLQWRIKSFSSKKDEVPSAFKPLSKEPK